MLGKIKRLLVSHEAQKRALAEWIFRNICEAVKLGRQENDLIIVKSRPLPEVGTLIEAGLIRDTLINDNPELAKIFNKSWKKHVKAYNITASFPKPGGEEQTLLFLGSYNSPWGTLTVADIKAGIIQGAALDFFEEAEKLASLIAKGKL